MRVLGCIALWLALPSTAPYAAAKSKSPKKSAEETYAAILAAPVTIAHKPGTDEGEAQMVIDGKVRKIAAHAVEAWKVRGGEAALVVVHEKAKGKLPAMYVLRYYDLDRGGRRVLGPIPRTSNSSLVESKNADEGWAFALSGVESAGDVAGRTGGGPVVLVGDDHGITGYIPGATGPVFSGDTKLLYTQAGAQKTAQIGLLLGTDLRGIYAPPDTEQASPKYLQVFPDGRALVELKNGSLAQGRWRSDGEVLELRGLAAAYAVPVRSLTTVKGIPAGARYSVRLTQELSSRSTHEGDIVHAVLITPIVVEGQILAPQGSKLEGSVVQANSVGWGFKHETASLTIHWTKLLPPDGRTIDTDARVFQVENAQEKVTDQGKIQGIRSTGTIGHSVENGVLSFAGIDPIAYVFASAAGSAVLGFAEPEILYPGGTELIVIVTAPVITDKVYPPTVSSMESDAAGREQLQAFVKKLPYRTRTQGSDKVSDLTNLVFIGDAAALRRAFDAAGWRQTDELYAGSTFKTVKTLTGNQAYTQAPMSVLLLDELPPLFTLSKTTNSFASRHHLRVFSTGQTYDGQTVLTSSSTQDIGIAFSRKQKTFIHVIDEHIDNERSKVVNDLMFTGCVVSLDMVDRPWVPRDAYNSTGDPLLTDGEAAVVRINDCKDPITTPNTPAPAPDRAQRATRDTSLTIRNDLYRGNLIYQGISYGLLARNYFKTSGELPVDNGAWRKTDASGSNYKGFGLEGSLAGADRSSSIELHRRQPGRFDVNPTAADLAAIKKTKEEHKWDPPRYEFALEGGYMHMREDYLSAVGLLAVSSNPNADAYFVFLADDVGDGWAGGGSVTVNSWRHFSNEFSYFRQQVKYQLASASVAIPAGTEVTIDENDLDVEPVGLVTRQVEYNLLIHPTRPTSRLRPYAAVGPALQLIALNGSPLKKPAGPFALGLKNIGLIKAAFDFGNTPPLDGGGIFQLGLQYGAGVKYRVSPRVMVRADWRETWSKNPNIIANSYEDYNPFYLDETYTTDITRIGPQKQFLQDRYTVGVAFTF
jgi:hypothetical protein